MWNTRRTGAGLSMTVLLAVSPSAAELPPPIQIDRLLVQAERETREGNHWSAVYTLERVLGLYEENDMDIPPAFWFRQATTFGRAGLHERAVAAATRYLQEAGRDGEHYQHALEVLDAAEASLAQARREEARARAAAERAEREAAARRQAIAPSIPEMVAVRAGRFQMGCISGRKCESNERPVREVEIGSFAMSKYEVTFEQWDVCTRYGGCRLVDDRRHRTNNTPLPGWGRGSRPVINVSWEDAQTYVSWLSRETGEDYRLPSEAEWEYAARAGTATSYWWGNDIGRNRANCRGCRSSWSRRTAPVGSFAANGFGLHDMHGNVKEWVQDCVSDGYRSALGDGAPVEDGDCSSRRLRGGSWGSKKDSVRSATRWSRSANFRDEYTGFRIAMTLGQ